MPLAALRAIHPKLPDALIERAVDAPLRPYFDALRARAAGDSPMTGYKLIRPDEEKAAEEGETEDAAAAGAVPAPEGKEEEQPLFFWFFFPLPGGRVAWEATTGSGRATYLFDAAAPVDQGVARLTRGLALVNFRREPIYLPDESLERQPRFRRYAIGCRKLRICALCGPRFAAGPSTLRSMRGPRKWTLPATHSHSGRRCILVPAWRHVPWGIQF